MLNSEYVWKLETEVYVDIVNLLSLLFKHYVKGGPDVHLLEFYQ